MSSTTLHKATEFIKHKANELGFFYCGISKADFLEEEAPRLEQWLKNGMHGQMSYMENYFDKRLDPRLLVENAKSVVSLIYNYFPEKELQSDLKVSKYAYGEDYHDVVKDKLKLFMAAIQESIGEVGGRVFVDSAPVMEKAWAQKSGLGWLGKNSNIISKQQGSFFFIAELIIDLELLYDGPIRDYCGTCTKCIDACPTDAIVAPYVVDGSKCISYYTIELKEAFSKETAAEFDNWIFGCDVCQDVCPWNRFSKAHQEPRFLPSVDLQHMRTSDWIELTEEVFKSVFKNSPLKRKKYAGIKSSVATVLDAGKLDF